VGGIHALQAMCVVPPYSQKFIFFVLLEVSPHPLRVGATCNDGGVVHHQWGFPFYFFIFSIALFSLLLVFQPQSFIF